MSYNDKREDVTIINIHTPNIGAPKCITQALTDMKGEIGSNTIVGASKPHFQ